MKIRKFNESHNEVINGSGLFFWNSTLDDNIKLEIVNWYNSLPPNEKKFVDILRNEVSDESEYFSRGD